MSTFQIAIIIVAAGYIFHILARRLDEIFSLLQETCDEIKDIRIKIENEFDNDDLKEEVNSLNVQFGQLEHHLYDVKEFFDISKESLEEKRRINTDTVF